MGIPHYYRSIVRHHKNILIAHPPKCHRFFIDFNAIVHQTAALILNESPATFTHDKVIKDTIQTTKQLITVVNPSDIVFIGIDGVAPRAKMVQQRKRRFMSAYRNKVLNDYLNKHHIKALPQWDSNAITPGTEFMKTLDAELKSFFAGDERVIISGSNEEGEGEQKLFDYINAHRDSSKINLINGMDADLIMLSLLSDQTIYLQRDNDIVDIQAFRRGILKHMGHVTGTTTPHTSLLHDYVFLCFLMGNDFIPHIPFLRIRDGGINVLITIYKSLYHSSGKQTLIQRNAINLEMLIAIFKELAQMEYSNMKATVDKVNNQHKTYIPKKPQNLKEFSAEIEHYPKQHKHKLLDIIPHEWHRHDWAQQYYKYLFNNIDSHSINKYALAYVEGLVWVYNYYFHRSYDRFWYYKYHVAPLSTDIFNILSTCDIKALTETLRKDKHSFQLTSDIQLLCVLPPQSKSLLSAQHHHLMVEPSSGLASYYPTGFEMCTFMKDFMWECTPILPDIDIERIHAKILPGC
jgi:5'-3' exonuclease